MDEVEMSLYAVEELSDELGDGVRLYESDDTCYEIRVDSGLPVLGDTADSRLFYRDGWQAKFHVPETDPETAYNEVLELAERLEEEYGFDPSMSAPDFDARRRNSFDGEVSGTFTFNEDADDTAYTSYRERSVDGQFMLDIGGMAGYASAGAATGGAIGMLLGPVGVAGGAGAGGVIGMGAAVGDLIGLASDDRTSPINLASKAPDIIRAKRRQRREEKLRDGAHARDRGFIEDLNRKRSIEPDYADTRDWELKEEYEALEDRDLEQRFEEVLDIAFHAREDAPGLHVTASFESYGEAHRFLSTLHDADVEEIDRPSLYDRQATFEQVFEHAREDDRDALVSNAVRSGTDALTDYLKDEAPDLLDRTMLDD